ncbi:hypothetical protein PEX2_067420 [Penicillium expansum]|uniref:Uncharacterized protein n=1 Tax=Penicillium expansum TaxID=27334 RepID=A0A0A2JS40_PENEN|nr:hypothetical protein PEX2_067420 [Penicillium expansum]KGO58232.1 hypothetical protein PEX2_067420 [Penicillium expansum]
MAPQLAPQHLTANPPQAGTPQERSAMPPPSAPPVIGPAGRGQPTSPQTASNALPTANQTNKPARKVKKGPKNTRKHPLPTLSCEEKELRAVVGVRLTLPVNQNPTPSFSASTEDPVSSLPTFDSFSDLDSDDELNCLVIFHPATSAVHMADKCQRVNADRGLQPLQSTPQAANAKTQIGTAAKGAKGATGKQTSKKRPSTEDTTEARATATPQRNQPVAAPGAQGMAPQRPGLPFTQEHLAQITPQQRAQFETHMQRHQSQNRERPTRKAYAYLTRAEGRYDQIA